MTNFTADTTAILSSLDIPAEYAALGLSLASRAPNPRGWLSCHAIDREDRTPSAAINVNTGRYVDLGASTQSRSLSLWDFAAANGSFADWQEARSHYAEKANVKLGKSKPPAEHANATKRDPANQLDFLPWSDITCHLWCEHKPGVTVEACLAAGARLAMYPRKKSPQQIKVIAFPCYGAELANADPVGWVVFHAGGLGIPVWKKDKKTGKLSTDNLPNGRSKTLYGSQAGLMNLHGIIRLQTATANEVKLVFKTEGVSDMLALFAAIPREARDAFPVVTNAGGTNQHLPPEITAAAFAGRRVAVVHDCDTPGQIGASQFCEQLSKCVEQVEEVERAN